MLVIGRVSVWFVTSFCVSAEACWRFSWKAVIQWLFCRALRFLAFGFHLLVCYESQKHLLSDRHCQTMEDNDRNIHKVPDLSRLMSAESKKRQRTHFHVFSKTRKLINKQPGDRRTALQDWKKCFIASRQNTLSYLFIWYTPIQCPCYKQYLCKAGLQLMITFIVESSADYFRG